MEFRERTTKQISAAIERMLVRNSERHSREIQICRAAIDDAVRSLEETDRRSVNQTDVAELRAYATMLVNEIAHIYTEDVAAATAESDITDRLRENLRCARQIYAQRALEEGPFAATLLEEELSQVIRTATPFTRALSAILAQGCHESHTEARLRTFESQP
jgi:hypothetical protein